MPFRTLATWWVCLYARMIICFSFDKNEQVKDAFDHGERNCTMTTSMDSFTFVGNMASLPLLSKLIFIYSIVLYFVRLLCLCFHFIINVDLWFRSLVIYYMLCIWIPDFWLVKFLCRSSYMKPLIFSPSTLLWDPYSSTNLQQEDFSFLFLSNEKTYRLQTLQIKQTLQLQCVKKLSDFLVQHKYTKCEFFD
mgnify:CR=1 FL=1